MKGKHIIQVEEMEGFEYMLHEHRSPPEEDMLLLFVFCFIGALFTTSTWCCLRRGKKPETPILPVLDTMVHSVPSADNPFLKLRVHTFSTAEEGLTPKPILNL